MAVRRWGHRGANGRDSLVNIAHIPKEISAFRGAHRHGRQLRRPYFTHTSGSQILLNIAHIGKVKFCVWNVELHGMLPLRE
jgi:hypothetical protein